MYRHFHDLISLDLRCLHFFVSADITVGHRCPSLHIKGAAVKGSQSHSQAYYKYLHPVMIEAWFTLLLEYNPSGWTIGGANYAVAALIDIARL